MYEGIYERANFEIESTDQCVPGAEKVVTLEFRY